METDYPPGAAQVADTAPMIVLASWAAEDRYQRALRFGYPPEHALRVGAELEPVPRVRFAEQTRRAEQAAAEERAAELGELGPGIASPLVTRRIFRPGLRTLVPAFVDIGRGGGVTGDGRVITCRRRPSLGNVLAAVPADIRRVFLVGPLPGGNPAGFSRWASRVPDQDGWAAGEHYSEKPETPLLRYEGPGRRVEIQRFAGWVGEGDYTAGEACGAWAELARMLAPCPVLATPTSTGRHLFATTIPREVAYPVLTDEHRELVLATAGQGRVEFCAEPGVELVGLAELDGRDMYPAVARNCPVGPVVHDHGDRFLGHVKARYRVAFEVPAGWAHVGLAGVWDELGAVWRYPARPGERAETWLDGCELALLERGRWSFEVRERLLFVGRGDPLGAFTRRLLSLRGDPGGPGTGGRPSELARTALRRVAIQTIGAFASRGTRVTRSLPVERSREVPATAIRPYVSDDGRAVLWQELTPPRWPELCHPEWAAHVWARTRARMLSGPGGTGALHVPRGDVLGMQTDALYLTRDPGWPDDGAPGRLRVKMYRPGPLPAPASLADLRALRDGVTHAAA